MKTLFTSSVTSIGGRSGSIASPEGLLSTKLGNPLEPGIEQRGPNPEMLFAGAYSACYHGAVLNAATKLGYTLNNSKVTAQVSLVEYDGGSYRIEVELHGEFPGIQPDQGRRIMDAAHQTCPYSKALRGDAPVKLVVDNPKPPSGLK